MPPIQSKTDPDQKPPSAKVPKVGKTDRKFQNDWIAKFPWIVYNPKWKDEIGMKCRVCIDSKLKLSNPVVLENGCVNMRTSTLNRHEQSADHKRAVTALKLKDNMSVTIQKSCSEKDATITKLLHTVYYIAKEKLAIKKYESMTEFMELVGCDLGPINNAYRSRKTADGLLSAISEAVDANVSEDIADSEFVSVSCDETTDISNTGKLILYIKTIDESLVTRSYFVGDYGTTDKATLLPKN